MGSRFLLLFLGLTLVSFFSWQLLAQNSSKGQFVKDTLPPHYDCFSDNSRFICTLEFDIKSFQKNKDDREYMPAKMTYYDADSIPLEQEFRIKARGNFRQQHCGLPPFWINVKKADIKTEEFEDYKKIKVVTHCRGGNSYNQYLLKEYLAYRIFNIISPYSFRVRLMQVTYTDIGRNNKKYTYWAFMIEPEEMMAQRLEAVPFKNDHISIFYTDTLTTDIMTLYQYMIGHVDFSVSGQHNLKLIKLRDPFRHYPIPVPYDLDYAGIVNAYYAVPRENMKIENVRERYYLGACRSEKDYEKALDIVLEKEEEIYSLISNFTYLNEKDRNEMLDYLKSFYVEAKGPGFLNTMHSTCLTPPRVNY